MNYFVVNGKSYDVLVVSLEENFNILNDENAGRTLAEGAPMVLSPIGTFYGHKITVARKKGYEKEFDELYMEISKPTDQGIRIECAHNQETIDYQAYVSSGFRNVQKIDPKLNKIYWGQLTINITPIASQRIAE